MRQKSPAQVPVDPYQQHRSENFAERKSPWDWEVMGKSIRVRVKSSFFIDTQTAYNTQRVTI